MKINEITAVIEKYAPKETAMEYDNVGLLVGGDDDECNGVLVCVDVTRGALEKAKATGCNLIVSHHPIIFAPMKSFLSDDYRAAVITEAFSNNIAVYAAHTNADRMNGNMSYTLLEKLGAKNVVAFMDGFGAVGDLNGITLKLLERQVADILDDNRVFSVGDKNKKIFRIAEINGAGADNDAIALARKTGVGLFIAADLKHHIMLEAKETDLCLMSVGHYASEKCFNDIVYDILKCHFDTLNIIEYNEGNPYN